MLKFLDRIKSVRVQRTSKDRHCNLAPRTRYVASSPLCNRSCDRGRDIYERRCDTGLTEKH